MSGGKYSRIEISVAPITTFGMMVLFDDPTLKELFEKELDFPCKNQFSIILMC
jgi:hypothetical protein